MIVDDLKGSILQLASEGKLVNQNNTCFAGKELENILKDEKDNKKYVYKKVLDEPFQIPENWIWVKLEDICMKITDGTHSTPKYTTSGIPFISVKDVSSGYINFDNTKFISKEEHDKLFERCNPEVGDLLITKVGTTGVPAIIDTTNQFSLFVSVALLKINSKKINNKFLYYFLKTPIVQKQVKENTRGVGNKNWVLDAIKNTILPLPPMEEQQRIVDRIECLFTKLDEIKPIEEELLNLKSTFPMDMKKSLLQYALSGKLCEQLSSDTSIENMLYSIREQKKHYKSRLNTFNSNNNLITPFDIPNTWRWVELKDIALDVYAGGDKPKKFSKVKNEKYSIPVIANGETNDGIVGYTDTATENENALTVAGRGTIGYSKYRNEPFTPIVRLIVIKLPQEVSYKYLQLVFELFIETGVGTSIKQLTVPMIINKYIPLPPIEEQQRIVDKLEQLLSLCEDIESLI